MEYNFTTPSSLLSFSNKRYLPLIINNLLPIVLVLLLRVAIVFYRWSWILVVLHHLQDQLNKTIQLPIQLRKLSQFRLQFTLHLGHLRSHCCLIIVDLVDPTIQ